MRHKTIDLIDVKADAESGTFTALASVFGNVDLVGDRIVKGAFTKTLERWRESGDPIPVILSHQWDDPMAMIGKADPAQVIETDVGLQVNGTLDMENPTARQAHKLMRERLLKGWSFGYTVPEGGEKRAKDGANDISELDLIEVGPTLKGANPEATLQAVKAIAAEELTHATDNGQDAEDEEPEGPTPKASDPLEHEIDLARLEGLLGHPVKEQP